MIVLLAGLRLDSRPGPLGDVHSSFDYVRVTREIVITEQQGELFRGGDAKLLGQNVNSVFLRVRGNDVGIVAWKGGGGKD